MMTHQHQTSESGSYLLFGKSQRNLAPNSRMTGGVNGFRDISAIFKCLGLDKINFNQICS